MRSSRRMWPIAAMAIGAVGLAIFLTVLPSEKNVAPTDIDPPTALETIAQEKVDRLAAKVRDSSPESSLEIGEKWTIALELECTVAGSTIKDGEDPPTSAPTKSRGRAEFLVQKAHDDGWFVAVKIDEIAAESSTPRKHDFALIFKKNGAIVWADPTGRGDENPAHAIFRLTGIVLDQGVLETRNPTQDEAPRMRSSSFFSPRAAELLTRLGCIVDRFSRPPVTRSRVEDLSEGPSTTMALDIIRYTRRLARGHDWSGRFEAMLDGRFGAPNRRRHRIEGSYTLREIIHLERPQKITADADLTSTARQFLVE